MQDQEPWVGCDLDGCLAFDTPGPYSPERIGPPIPAMLERLQQLIRDGQRVKIFTARATVPQNIPYVKEWLQRQGLPDLEVTNVKDFA